ncbi:ribonuclease H-like domain-containing protein [Massariosphaeria phaeospora]|uniref:Ribonuclease H-like domain-containing protein n=1 Tax=Massariosphaeria phaeospora TaxID=100035 RepID=A0A7C8MIA1_9PLEO|nr:ribonuclease H-like domain-containing protein [Massariosphaeria phaeospora]
MASKLLETIADSPTAIAALVDRIDSLETDHPCLFLDLEGVNLCRDGSISILTLLVQPSPAQKRVYLVDVYNMGRLAFNTPGKSDRTLKHILESPAIPKVLFDLRNDSDALYAHFNVALQGVEDVQLMENASRVNRSRERLSGLAKCIEFDSAPFLNILSRKKWELAKEEGDRLWNPRHGGSFEVFNARPLSPEIISYCVGDLRYLPQLRDLYWGKLTPAWKAKVAEETRNRVRCSQAADYVSQGPDKALGPPRWDEKRQAAALAMRTREESENDQTWETQKEVYHALDDQILVERVFEEFESSQLMEREEELRQIYGDAGDG